MKRFLVFIFCSLLSLVSNAQDLNKVSFDKKINEAMKGPADAISTFVFYPVVIAGKEVPIVLIWLVLAALLFTFYFTFINVRVLGHAFSLIKGDYDNPNDKGEVSHFQALTAALSGTVGLGNIAGVAVAVSVGGPGATFWMIVAGFLGMTSKFVECTLGVKYRRENADGSVSGGPMYYLSKGLEKFGIGSIPGKILAVFFAVMCVGGSFGGGNMFQGNQATQQIQDLVTAWVGPGNFLASNGWVIGVLMAIVVAMVILGGIKSIARVTDKVVPFMCGIYVLAALIILFKYIDLVPETFILIMDSAFEENALYGGFLGVMIQGFRRAAFSNEAGIGSASIAHAAAKTNEPVSEGIVALLEPFIDTIIVCTMTALVTIITGEYLNPETKGIAQTSAAFGHVLSWFPYVLSVAVVLFALSTMISWSYYGLKAWTYLFGEGRVSELSYKFIFCIFIVLGASMSMQSVIDFSDAMIFAMSFANIIGLYLLAPEVKRDLKDYFARIRSGEIKKYK